jgi:serpin B
MKHIPIVLIALALAGGLGLAGCTTDAAGPPITTADDDIVKSDKARLTADASPSSDREVAAHDAASFAFDLYHEVATPDVGNVVVSPHSISSALTMTFAGAEVETERQMREALSLSLAEPALHRAMNAIDLGLAERNRPAEHVSLEVLNTVWAQSGYPVTDTYLDVLAENYGAGVHLVDFGDPDAARADINAAVGDQTRGRIDELIPDGVIDALTRLVLTNTIYFNGQWKYPFDADRTAPGDFTRLDGTTTSVDFMHGLVEAEAVETADFQAVALPYALDELAFVAIMPRNDFASWEAGADAAMLETVLASLAPGRTSVSLPRLSYGTAARLDTALKTLGMLDAFDRNTANFSGIDGTRDLYIQAVVHQANLDVNESGTEAAGATAVVIGTRSAPDFTIALDRPFLFAIVDRPTGAALFLGRVTDPSPS